MVGVGTPSVRMLSTPSAPITTRDECAPDAGSLIPADRSAGCMPASAPDHSQLLARARTLIASLPMAVKFAPDAAAHHLPPASCADVPQAQRTREARVLSEVAAEAAVEAYKAITSKASYSEVLPPQRWDDDATLVAGRSHGDGRGGTIGVSGISCDAFGEQGCRRAAVVHSPSMALPPPQAAPLATSTSSRPLPGARPAIEPLRRDENAALQVADAALAGVPPTKAAGKQRAAAGSAASGWECGVCTYRHQARASPTSPTERTRPAKVPPDLALHLVLSPPRAPGPCYPASRHRRASKPPSWHAPCAEASGPAGRASRPAPGRPPRTRPPRTSRLLTLWTVVRRHRLGQWAGRRMLARAVLVVPATCAGQLLLPGESCCPTRRPRCSPRCDSRSSRKPWRWQERARLEEQSSKREGA